MAQAREKTKVETRPEADLEELPMAPIEDGGVVDAEPDAYFGEDAATLGDRVAAARQNAGLTQAGLASRMGVGKAVISGWENDRTEPRANRLQMLAGMLNVSVAWLLTGSGEGVSRPEQADEPAPATVHIAALAADQRDAQRFFGDLLGCALERAAEDALEFDLFGHRVLVQRGEALDAPIRMIEIDGLATPFPHTGIVLAWENWRALADRLRGAGAAFLVEPTIRAVGAAEEHGVFALDSPVGTPFVFRASGPNWTAQTPAEA